MKTTYIYVSTRKYVHIYILLQKSITLTCVLGCYSVLKANIYYHHHITQFLLKRRWWWYLPVLWCIGERRLYIYVHSSHNLYYLSGVTLSEKPRSIISIHQPIDRILAYIHTYKLSRGKIITKNFKELKSYKMNTSLFLQSKEICTPSKLDLPS